MKYVSYYRVSTQKQGISGLGLGAQKTAVNNFLKEDDDLVKEFTEVESGKSNTRPILNEAIEYCKKHNVTLLIAKLDRLSRNVSFIYKLRDSEVDFVCTDMPNASKVTIGIMAVLAQDERERISQRTKQSLAELKAKGIRLGSPKNLTDKARLKSIEVRRYKSLNDTNNKRATALIVASRNASESYHKIADRLNESDFRTRRDKRFTSATVKRLYDRYLKYNKSTL